jgi:hypothetical protein
MSLVFVSCSGSLFLAKVVESIEYFVRDNIFRLAEDTAAVQKHPEMQ